MNPVKPSVATEYVTDFIMAGLTPMIHGSPGIGKSDIVRQIANEFNLKVIDLRLSQSDPTDLNGFPKIGEDKAGYLPMDTFPIEGDPLPDGKSGWLLFLDELPSAPQSVQAAAYKLILDRAVGKHNLHRNLVMVAAGNLESDNAIVNRMGTAMQSRLAHLELIVDSKDWLEWARSNDIDYRITSYIAFRPSVLHMFDPDHSEYTFACPRTWEFASRLLKRKQTLSHSIVNMLSGVISPGPAAEFFNFSKVFHSLPEISDIKKKPESAPLPSEPSTLYAMAGLLGEHVNEDTETQFLTYCNRLPKEFQVITIKEMSRRYPEITANDLFLDKATELAQLL